jgi:hypothetical protein
MKKYIDDQIKIWTEELSFDLRKKSIINITVSRMDAVVVTTTFKEFNLAQQNAAICSGIWQAATNSIELVANESDFKLCFETTQTGLLIYPLNLDKNQLIVCVNYLNVINPGYLKNRIRNLRDSLARNYVSENKQHISQYFSDEYVFSDLSDDEVSSLFDNIRI